MVLLHKRKTPRFRVLYNESDQTNFLYCRRYDSVKNKAFVTGSASNWRCVFSLIPFKHCRSIQQIIISVDVCNPCRCTFLCLWDYQCSVTKVFAEFRIVYEARKKAVDFIQDSDKSILFIWDKTDAWIGAEKLIW